MMNAEMYSNSQLYWERRQDGKSARSEAALRSHTEKKGMIMQKRVLLWIMPIIMFLIMATALILSPAIFSHAAGKSTTAPVPVATPVLSATSTPEPSRNPQTNTYWFD